MFTSQYMYFFNGNKSFLPANIRIICMCNIATCMNLFKLTNMVLPILIVRVLLICLRVVHMVHKLCFHIDKMVKTVCINHNLTFEQILFGDH